MAVTYGFYNALNHDRLYDAIQMSSIFDGIIRDGIFSTIGDHMVVSAPEDGWYVNVGSGRAWFNHTWTLNDTDYPIEPEEAEVVLDRIDAVILEVNAGAEVRANSIKFLKGTPSSEPVKPTLTHNAEVNQYALAYVRIRAGQTTIFQTDIENAVGTDETPFITGLLQQVSIETLLTQWEAEFNTYFTNFQSTSTTEFNNWLATKVAEYTAWFAQMQTDMDSDFEEFDAWFQRMKDQLSEDAAGHLQAEIDELAEAAQKGSIVTVTTTDPTLFNRPVTISQTGFDPVTSSFNASGVAYFETVPMVGDVAIEATNGTLTAHGVLNIPYFGRYNTTLEFWEAVLDISTSMTSLYNRQITVTKNSSTIGTTTFDATGHATFAVHSIGTYNVSATDSFSRTYDTDVEVTEETTYPVDLGGEIDGSTVEPTDDITTWLKCANIEDASITTLADVLANRSLFETLIANSNACKYMARSTTWADSKVPLMTSNTTPSGEVIYSSIYSSTYDAFHAFDRNDSTTWTSTSSDSNIYIGYHFDSDVNIKRVDIKRSYRSNIPDRSLSFKVSDDGLTWTEVGTGTLRSIQGTPFQTYELNNNYSKKYFAVFIDAYLEGDGILQMQFYGGIVNDADAMSLIGKYDYCSNALLSNATWAEAIANSEYYESVLNVKVPTMTSATTPSGEVITNSPHQSYPAWNAFDASLNSTFWASTTGTSTNVYLGYKFDEPIMVTRMGIINASYNSGGSYNQGVKDFDIKYSDDGTIWSSAVYTGVATKATSTTQGWEYFGFASSGAHRYWIIYCKNNYGDSYNTSISQLQFYGRKSEEVYVPLIPIMTSNTTPSGEVTGTAGDLSHYYKIFNESASEDFSQQNLPSGLSITYTFDHNITIDRIGYHSTSYSPAQSYLKGFTLNVYIGNNGTFTQIGTRTFTQTEAVEMMSAMKYIECEHSTGDAVKVSITASNYNYQNVVSIGYIQFYQKQVQTNIIHSAPNDTIYMIENGSPVVLTTTNSDGDGILDFTQFIDGTYTLYSSIAKDPTNLSNDYSKSVRITKTSYGCTTEAYLMPDAVKTLYWFGYESDNLEDMSAANGWTIASNYSFFTATHQTNYVDINGVTQKTGGVGTKNAVNIVSEYHTITKGITLDGGNAGTVASYSSKNTTTSNIDYILINTTNLKYDYKDASSRTCYLTSQTSNARRFYLYALWYE